MEDAMESTVWRIDRGSSTGRFVFRLFAASLVLCCLGSRALAASTTLSASQDAWIDKPNATTNNGSTTAIQVQGRQNSIQRGLVQFDVSSIGCAAVTSATLRLRVDSNSLSTSVTHDVHRALVSWTEGGVTWNSRNGTTNWSTAGGAAGTDFETVATASTSTGTGTGFIEWNVTADVQAYVSGAATNNGWFVKKDTETSANNNENNTIISYASRENATTANRPELDKVGHVAANVLNAHRFTTVLRVRHFVGLSIGSLEYDFIVKFPADGFRKRFAE
jgi:hypothetical protein